MTFANRLMADPDALARSLARRHNLVCNDGSVVCWNCRRESALMPSLHCGACLGETWRRLGIIEPRCEQREQTEDDKRLMAPLTGAAEEHEQSNE